MNKSTIVPTIVVVAIAVTAWLRLDSARRGPSVVVHESKGGSPPGAKQAPGKAAVVVPGRPKPVQELSAAEKAARVEKIKGDYDEIRTKLSTEFAAAGTNFPGGLHAFLRQLALLEREKHGDLALVLNARELEDLEMRETSAGLLVQRLLGDTTASEQQRREVFRLQQTFEDQFALTFNLTAPALYAREVMRLGTQEKIHGLLGDGLFAAWLRGEGTEFAQIRDFATRQGLPADAALNLWRARNELTVRRLELAARPELSNDQRRAAQDLVTREAEARVAAILGPGAMEVAKQEVLGWLPGK